jgi:lysyl-tRNA synthetase class 2
MKAPIAKASPWWTPSVHADRRPFLIGRNAIQSALRGYFAGEDFIEVDTATLQVSPGNEAHLHAFATEALTTDGKAAPFYLHTSPEFACKKLLAAGETRIFELARVFRDRERGDRHLPEFTMLEWYRANEDYEVVIRDTVAIIQLAAKTAGTTTFSFRGLTADASWPPEFLTVFDAFTRFSGVDLAATVRQSSGDRDALADAARYSVRVADDDTWTDIFSKILVEHVEPHLGRGRLTVLIEYPTPEAALARTKPSDPRVAERFEVYACGVELANGFGELTDADEQRRRFVESMDEKERRYGERYPIDEEFLAAVAAMPPASGVALGFDRLVMLAAGATNIDQVVWTPPV